MEIYYVNLSSSLSLLCKFRSFCFPFETSAEQSGEQTPRNTEACDAEDPGGGHAVPGDQNPCGEQRKREEESAQKQSGPSHRSCFGSVCPAGGACGKKAQG